MPEKESVEEMIHYRLKPLVLQAMTYAGGFKDYDKLIQKKKLEGFRCPAVQAFFDSMTRAKIRIDKEIEKEYGHDGKDWRLTSAIGTFTSIVSLILESERYWTPIWANIIMEEFEKTGMIRVLGKFSEPKRLKHKEIKDKFGQTISREVIQDG